MTGLCLKRKRGRAVTVCTRMAGHRRWHAADCRDRQVRWLGWLPLPSKRYRKTGDWFT